MAKEKRKLPKGAAGGPKERHKRTQKSQFDPKAPMPVGFVAKPSIPKSKSKHHIYFEFVENDNKKKKLDFQITTKSTPPPGFEFVPIGNPALTSACKEISREKDAMIFIVSNTKEVDPNHLSHHVHRTGHHIRQVIVEEARAQLEHMPAAAITDGKPEPLPETQEEYTTQANSAILDLFPRIPHTDRQSIIIHAFNLAAINHSPKPVGLCADMLLSRRVQLAVLAHIRHNHTRYDELLKETSWQNARKVVEPLCLDILVKWRGDEETGRDQLDEILREVVVISDSDSEESEDEDQEDITPDASHPESRPEPHLVQTRPYASEALDQTHAQGNQQDPHYSNGTPRNANQRVAAKKEQRGFKRYRAWEDAIQRNRLHDHEIAAPQMGRTVSHGNAPFYGSQAYSPKPMEVDGPPGSVPAPNGFVPQQSQPATLLTSSFRPAPYSPARPGYEQVSSTTRDCQRGHTPASRHASPVADRLQDMLVRSIEPVSPGTMLPSFVRTLPPRPQLSPARRPVAHRMAPVPVAQDPPNAGEGSFQSERRVVSDRPFFDPLSRRQPRDGYDHPSSYWGPEQRGVTYQYPMSSAAPRAHELVSSSRVPAQTIAIGRERPEYHNPDAVLMEDRGGYFERVYHDPQSAHYRTPANVGMTQLQLPYEAAPRVREPHRVVNWGEGSRIVRDSRDDRDAQVIPTPGHPPIPSDSYSRAEYMNPYPDQPRYESWPQRSTQAANNPAYYGGPAAEPLPQQYQREQGYAPAPSRSHQGVFYDNQYVPSRAQHPQHADQYTPPSHVPQPRDHRPVHVDQQYYDQRQ